MLTDAVENGAIKSIEFYEHMSKFQIQGYLQDSLVSIEY